MKLKKKNVITTGLAVSLAAVMLIGGGTFAYLSDSTEAVNNEFNTGKVTVDLYETDADGDKVSSRDDYNIIPGTSEKKDPTVTVNATVDAYVFVVVTDNTDGLVTYTIDDGWTQLDGYNNVYYREVTGSKDKQLFTVLKDNKVSYDYTLENSNMIDDEGNLKDGIELSFKAYAIQKEPFTNAKTAYEVSALGITLAAASDSDGVLAAIEDGETVLLADDVTIEAKSFYNTTKSSDSVTIDLNGHELTLKSEESEDYWRTPSFKGDVTISNGTLTCDPPEGKSALIIRDGASLTLDNATVDLGSGDINVNKMVKSADITIKNSEVESSGSYVIDTNASNSTATTTYGDDLNIKVEDSIIRATGSDSAAILMNVPGALSIYESVVVGQTQGVIVRCGYAGIIRSTITTEATAVNDYNTSAWSSGNNVAAAALVVGNYTPGSTGYPHDALCAVVDNDFVVGDDSVPQVVLGACNGYTTTFATENADDIDNMIINKLIDSDSNSCIEYTTIVG